VWPLYLSRRSGESEKKKKRKEKKRNGKPEITYKQQLLHNSTYAFIFRAMETFSRVLNSPWDRL